MQGYVDHIGCDFVSGWSRGDVQIVLDRRFVHDVHPDIERQDLKDAGISGFGFRFDLANELPNYTPREVIVRKRSSVQLLPGGYFSTGSNKPYIFVESCEQATANRDRLFGGATRGVILFTSRSGGTLLLDTIRSHPDAYAFSEPLDSLAIFGEGATYTWVHDYFTVPSQIEYFRTVENPKLMLLSTKIHNEEVSIFKLLNYFNTKYLRLYRKNILKQAISGIVAKELFANTNNFNSTSKLKAKQKIYLNPVELFAAINSYEAAEQRIDNAIFKYAEGNVLSISYEEISGEKKEEAFNKIFDYFGLQPIPINTQFKKINSNDLSIVIENYDEVYKEVMKTRYGWMLE